MARLLPAIFVLALGSIALAQEHAAAPEITHAVAVLHPTEGNTVSGVVRFTQTGDQVRVQAEIRGLTANSEHGFHVHEFGDCSSADASSAGPHYNPGGHSHSLPPTAPRHAGDFGNLKSDAQGVAKLDLTVDNLSLAGETAPILGRAVIVHAKPDTGKGDSGEAGARVACGVIGVGKGQ